MNALTPFAFGENMVRVIPRENGEPLFIAKDVALALGYEWNGSSRVAHVPSEWRVVTSVVTTFGEKDTICLTEQGLYFFLGRSDKPNALPFQKWIAGEVLPSLRRTGAYVLPERRPTGTQEIFERFKLPESLLAVRPRQRVRLMDLAAQIARMDDEQAGRVFAAFAKLCDITGLRFFATMAGKRRFLHG